MSVFVLKRGPAVRPAVVAVEITGEGFFYDEISNGATGVTIHGETYTAAAADISVQPGDVIVFHVAGAWQDANRGTLTIDGIVAHTTTEHITTETYEWSVPEGITQIAINLATRYTIYCYISTITVTTS